MESKKVKHVSRFPVKKFLEDHLCEGYGTKVTLKQGLSRRWTSAASSWARRRIGDIKHSPETAVIELQRRSLGAPTERLARCLQLKCAFLPRCYKWSTYAGTC